MMARNLAQGADAKSGAQRSPAPASGLHSTSAGRLKQLENSIYEVRHSTSDRLEAMSGEITGLQQVLEIKGQETENTLGLMRSTSSFEHHLRQCASTTREDKKVKTHSQQHYEVERYLISTYSGDREDLHHFISRSFS